MPGVGDTLPEARRSSTGAIQLFANPDLTNFDVQAGLLPYHCLARRLNLRAIFISYRRSDSEGEAGRLFDALID
jgi:hypothetical protein